MDDYDDTRNIAATLADRLPKAEQLPSIGLEDAPGFSISRVALPIGWQVHETKHDLEQYLPAPRRTKATATFATVGSFLAYIHRHRSPSSVVWCDFNPQTYALGFTAIIDEHDKGLPAWRGHRALFAPDFSAEWKAWKGSDTKPKEQVAFAEWIQEHDEDIHAAEGYPSALQMLTMATEFASNGERVLKSAVRLQSGGVRMHYVDTDDEATVQAMTMFEKFMLGIPVFHGGTGFTMAARLKYSVRSGAVSFRYELVRPDRVHEHAAMKLIEAVREGLGETPLLMGNCS